jgi:hypothetical protein
MDNQSTTPTGSAPGAGSWPGTQGRSERGDGSQADPGVSRPGSGGAEDAKRLVKEGAEQIGREARDLKDAAGQGAAQGAETVRQMAGQTAEQVTRQAGQLASQLKEKGAAMLDQQRSRAADLIGDCVSATRRAAQKLHDENDHNLAGYADALADGLDSTARYLREQDARKLVDDAADLARRRPEWVLGGAFVVGLAVARFLKASRPSGAAYGSYRYDRPEEFGADEYRSGGGSGEGYGLAGSGGAGGEYARAGVRAYAPPAAGSDDAFGQGAGSPFNLPQGGDAFGQGAGSPSNLSGTSPGTLDTPGVTTTATESWRATGLGDTTDGGAASAPGGSAPATGGPDPTLPGTASPSNLNRDDAARRDNPGGPQA